MHIPNRPDLTPEQEAKWNERARVFVSLFQRVFDVGDGRADSLAGPATFGQLRALDTHTRVSEHEWDDVSKELRALFQFIGD